MLTAEMETSTSTQSWHTFFSQWPADLKHGGVVIAECGEQIPFDGFMISDEMLVIKRTNPDALGARQVILPFANIAALKLTEPAKTKVFANAGYKGAFPKQ